jgi:hypothetical protein
MGFGSASAVNRLNISNNNRGFALWTETDTSSVAVR